MTYLYKFLLGGGVSSGILFLDRYTKSWAIHTLFDQDLPIFPGLNLTLSFNRGISWSFFSFTSPQFFWILTTFIILMLLWFTYLALYSSSFSKSMVGKLMVVVGASSNIIDRFVYGGVVDFIDCSLGSWHWPSFNVADMAIVTGIGIIIGRMYYDQFSSKHT